MLDSRREEARRYANPFTLGACSWTDEEIDSLCKCFFDNS